MHTSIKLLGLTIVLGSATAMAIDNLAYNSASSATQGAISKNADNTDMNTRDKNGNTLTPQDQPNSEADRKLLADVRSAIVDDDDLSTAAHNVKIMVVNGVVTLRGPVKNASEKTRVEQIARSVTGVVNIENRLDIDVK